MGVFARAVSVPGVLGRDSSTRVFVGKSVEGVFERASMMGAVFGRESTTGVLGRTSEAVGVFVRISVAEGILGRESTIELLAGETVLPPIFWDNGREGNEGVGATLSSEKLP